jgi:alpha-glucosidase (family GH31 glycosyl hydrolase)
MYALTVVVQLGDNYSKWQYMYLNIQGVLQFQIYQIPMVGADTCGFSELSSTAPTRTRPHSS